MIGPCSAIFTEHGLDISHIAQAIRTNGDIATRGSPRIKQGSWIGLADGRRQRETPYPSPEGTRRRLPGRRRGDGPSWLRETGVDVTGTKKELPGGVGLKTQAGG